MDALEYAKRICYSSEQTLMFSYHMAVKYKDAPGVYCEMGVAAGAQIIAMAHGAPNKTIYAFDSFQGIPLPSNRDDQMPGVRDLTQQEISELPSPGKQKLETTGVTSVSENDFNIHMLRAFMPSELDFNKSVSLSYIDNLSRIKPVKGWFEETVPKSDTGPIAILRLDGDLYSSTFVCLEHLFPKVIKGGCVIIDDWQLSGCKAACNDYFGDNGYTPDYKFISNIAYFYK